MTTKHVIRFSGVKPIPATDRLLLIDIGKTIALAGMVIFHFVRDLEFFGLIPEGTTLSGAGALSARLIAGAFIFLSGVSLVLAHRTVFRKKAWAKRTGTILAAALLISVVSYIAVPDRYIYFGILHAIAVFVLLGPLVLRLPAVALFALAMAALAIQWLFGRGAVDVAALAWTGLSATVPASFDFIPFFPWVAVFLVGMGAARAVPRAALAWVPPTVFWSALAQPGRHSLMIYLLHQPLLLALIWVATTAI